MRCQWIGTWALSPSKPLHLKISMLVSYVVVICLKDVNCLFTTQENRQLLSLSIIVPTIFYWHAVHISKKQDRRGECDIGKTDRQQKRTKWPKYEGGLPWVQTSEVSSCTWRFYISKELYVYIYVCGCARPFCAYRYNGLVPICFDSVKVCYGVHEERMMLTGKHTVAAIFFTGVWIHFGMKICKTKKRHTWKKKWIVTENIYI